MDFEEVHRRHPFIKWFFIIFFLVILVVGGICGYWIYTAPKLSGKAINQDQSATEYLDANGHVFYSTDSTPMKKTTEEQFKHATVLKNALLSIEDRDFYSEKIGRASCRERV